MALTYSFQRPHVLALIGLPDAGKTSFLITLYDRIRQEPLGKRDFAGSFTLRGWETIHQHLKWRQDVPPAYPPRTSGVRREPGLLHLALRDQEDMLMDVLLADTPGEWFKNYSRDEEHAGALTTLDLADGFLFIVNPVTLCNALRHASTQRLTGLIRRLHEKVPNKPFVLVLSHADQPYETTTQYDEVMALIQNLYPGHLTFKTIAAFEKRQKDKAGQDVLEAVSSLLSIMEVTPPRTLPVPEREPLLARMIKEDA